MKKHSPVNIDTVKYSVTGMKFDIPCDEDVIIIDRKTHKVRSQGTNRFSLPGKGGHNLSLRTFDFHQRLRVEGSLGGFLSGQNIVTSADMRGLCLGTLREVLGAMGLKRSPELVAKCQEGDIDLARVDLACNFVLDSEAQVRSIIGQMRRQFAAQGCYSKSRGTSAYLFPDNGKGYEIVLYAKGAEMRRSKRLQGLESRVALLEGTKNVLRVEVRLKGDLASLGLHQVRYWSESVAEETFWKYVSLLKLDQVTSGHLLADDLERLPYTLRPLFAHHKAGTPLEQIKQMYSPATLRRHRARLLNHGVNLTLPNISSADLGMASDVITTARTIIGMPQWLTDAGYTQCVLPRAQ